MVYLGFATLVSNVRHTCQARTDITCYLLFGTSRFYIKSLLINPFMHSAYLVGLLQ